jgi:hypothetical protein
MARSRAVVVIQWQAVGGPLAQGDGERLLHGGFCEADVTEDPDQSGYLPA